ncbi:MAG: DUF5013 domain-containing protein [Paraprevotella sp.]|nr:DUF5013 domain-containing protein [Paraprevotella sp.]
MKNKQILWTILGVAALAQPALGQTDWDRKKYPDYSPRLKPSAALAVKKAAGNRPERVNNAETIYFPPVFNQSGGSCGSASRIAYMFNYEMNAFRGLDGSLEENQYPTHFTWLLTNSGSSKDAMAIANGVPTVPVYGGRTYSQLFGNQDCSDTDFGWMNGYDKWYSAMFNRLERTANFPVSVETEEGREAVKNWLWNHNGDADFKAGGICGIGVASNGVWEKIPSTATNDEIGASGKAFVQRWGSVVDHALTIVGYDDRIEFDLDGNGIAGEPGKDETGAWIIVNSWGAWWNNNGFVYCPYKNAVTTSSGTSYYYPEVYHIRKDYRPLRTFKIKMEYDTRSELCLSAGIASDINATEPERTVQFEHFKYAGDGDGNGQDAATPMLGRWADGMHYEPMEFGYDLTDLSARFDTRRPLKYFFIIETKAQASGSGKVHSCSLMDYEFDKEGVEFPFDTTADGVKIENQGKRTVLTLVVGGEPLYAPRNPVVDGEYLKWEAPAASPYLLKEYRIYKDGVQAGNIGVAETSFRITADGRYGVSAVYDYNDTAYESAVTEVQPAIVAGFVPEQNYVRSFDNSGFCVKNLFSQPLSAATIEYWLRPASCTDWNQQMGPGWNAGFFSHATRLGEFVAGWNTGNRVTTATGTLKARQWSHVAVVIDGGHLTTYINGEKAGEVETSYKGLDAFGDFNVGTAGTGNALNGHLDEMRVWSVARSQNDIRRLMYAEVADPENTPGLLLELKMNEESAQAPVDATGRHTVEMLTTKQTRVEANSLFAGGGVLTASFDLPEAACYVGTELCPRNTSSATAVRWVWSVEGTDMRYTVENPVFVFDEPGEKQLKLTAYDVEGNSSELSRTITVLAQESPVADFYPHAENVAIGSRVSFINATRPSEGCRYEWAMPGAVTEHAVTTHAATSYEKPGVYTVTLTAINAAGSHSVSHQVHVMESAPLAAFEATPTVLLKGQTVTLKDISQHGPDAWSWVISNASHALVGEEETFTTTMDDPGRYDVRLEVSNGLGSDELTRKGAIIVCNADALTGLNFTGSSAETVTFNTPISSKTGFTIEWWMYAKGSRNNSQWIGGSSKDLKMLAMADGSMSVSMGGMTYKTSAGFITPAEWHHYAMVFDNGRILLYKDCHLTAMFDTPWTEGNVPSMPEQMQLGGKGGPMNAVIDEFRVWNTALSEATLKGYANQPIDDVAAAEAQDKLTLYYNFNQNSGNVADATSNANTGVRSGFGPEGDAWTTSLGVFSLDRVVRPDVTADYLTNYQMPFLASDKVVNPVDPARFRALLQASPQSTWKIENPTIFSDIITGVYVDGTMEDAMALMTKDMDFEAEVKNHKVYQTVTLPAGFYVFGVKGYNAPLMEQESYVVAAAGDKLPNTGSLSSEALAYASLLEGEVAFSLDKPSQVSLGMVLNVMGENTLAFSRFYLEKLFTNVEFGGTGIAEAPADERMASGTVVEVSDGRVCITVPSPRSIALYSLTGMSVYKGYVTNSVTIVLKPGIYILDGRKIVVR